MHIFTVNGEDDESARHILCEYYEEWSHWQANYIKTTWRYNADVDEIWVVIIKSRARKGMFWDGEMI